MANCEAGKHKANNRSRWRQYPRAAER